MLLWTSLEGSAGGGPSPPTTPLLVLDFVNGIYQVNGADFTLADVIDKPSFVTGGSLQLRFANETTRGSGVPNVIGDALAALVPNPAGTFVLDWEELSGTFTGIPFSVQDGAGDPDAVTQLLQFQRSGGGDGSGVYVLEDDGSDFRDVNLLALSGLGRRQLAMTVASTKMIGSVDGQSTIASGFVGSVDPTCDTASFGSLSGDWLFDELNILRLILYPERPDSDLPSLSAL